MLAVELLNARHGDAIFIEYGDPERPHRILIDGGPYHAYDDPGGLLQRLQALPEDQRRLDLVVMTHIDTDHIDGVITLLQEAALGLTIDDLWFNGWKHLHLAVEGLLGGKQGQFLGALIEHLALPWNLNTAWGATHGVVVVPEDGPLPVARLPGGATATLLSPSPGQLGDLHRDWAATLRAADFDPDDPRDALEKLRERRDLRPVLGEGVLGKQEDTSSANASSIAFVFEYEGDRVLFAGDAFASVLEAAARRYTKEYGALEVAAFKLPHHGSWSNLSPELLHLVTTDTYLVSTNGKYYDHPDDDAIELIMRHGGQPSRLVFNYEQEHTRPWLDPVRQSQRAYTALRCNRLVLA
jgi:hypothetical protein